MAKQSDLLPSRNWILRNHVILFRLKTGMKNVIYLLTLIIALISASLFSCSSEEPAQEPTEETGGDGYISFDYGEVDVYHIQEIDGCEYILVNGRENTEPALTHKGNCKYCEERNKSRSGEVAETKEIY